MLIREEPATELVVATRILARAERLAADGRVTLRAGEVVYIAARGTSSHTLTPYDVAIVRLADGDRLVGVPPDDVARYLDAYRADPAVASVIARTDGALLSGTGLRACALRALADDAPAGEEAVERVWRGLVAEARGAGALVGASAAGEE